DDDIADAVAVDVAGTRQIVTEEQEVLFSGNKPILLRQTAGATVKAVRRSLRHGAVVVVDTVKTEVTRRTYDDIVVTVALHIPASTHRTAEVGRVESLLILVVRVKTQPRCPAVIDVYFRAGSPLRRVRIVARKTVGADHHIAVTVAVHIAG